MNTTVGNKEGLETYSDYLIDLEQNRKADWVAQIPEDVLKWLIHVPLLASFEYSPHDPVIRTISVGRSPDRSLPDLLIRRDLSPFRPVYQVPFAVVPGDADERPALLGRCLRHYLDHNGVGRRATSRPYLTGWPGALMLCDEIAGSPLWLANSVITAAEKADLRTDRELRLIDRFGTRYAERYDQETEDAIEAVFVRMDPDPQEIEASSSSSPQLRLAWPREIEWPDFRKWWDHATSGSAVVTFLEMLPAVWSAAIERSSRIPGVSTVSMASWLKLFVDAYHPESHVPSDGLSWDDLRSDTRVDSRDHGSGEPLEPNHTASVA